MRREKSLYEPGCIDISPLACERKISRDGVIVISKLFIVKIQRMGVME